MAHVECLYGLEASPLLQLPGQVHGLLHAVDILMVVPLDVDVLLPGLLKREIVVLGMGGDEVVEAGHESSVKGLNNLLRVIFHWVSLGNGE